jgi:hypothetical protein
VKQFRSTRNRSRGLTALAAAVALRGDLDLGCDAGRRHRVQLCFRTRQLHQSVGSVPVRVGRLGWLQTDGQLLLLAATECVRPSAADHLGQLPVVVTRDRDLHRSRVLLKRARPPRASFAAGVTAGRPSPRSRLPLRNPAGVA